MSSEIVAFIDYATQIIMILIQVLAVFRAITIGRVLVSRVYRDRAYFVGALIVTQIIQPFVPDNWHLFGLYAYEITYFALIFFILTFIDNTILVALDMDFFHRNTLHWRQTRLPVYVIYVIDVVLILLVTNNYLSPPRVVNLPVIGSFVAIFIYAAAVLVVAARRTPDKPMRQFLTYAGLLVLGYLVGTLINKYTYIDAVDVFDDLLGVGLAYVAYRMVMSLSPMSKIEKESEGPLSK